MSRIRVIHPSFWIDHALMPSMQKCLFLGLYNHADDAGIFEWEPKILRFKILPNDKVKVEKLLNKLEEEGLIISYEVDGKKYGEIIDFSNQQRTKNPVYKYPSRDSLGSSKDALKGSLGSSKVVDKDLLGKSFPKNNNKNNNLQKKLSTDKDKDKDKDKESPLTPQPTITTGEVISIHTHNHFLNQILSLLKDHTNLPEQECRAHIKQWIEKMENAQVVIDLVKSGISKGDPISYISKCVENEAKKRISSPDQEKSASWWDVIKAKFEDDPDFQKLNRDNQTQVLLLLKETPAKWFLKHCENHAPDAWKYYQKHQQKQEKVA